MQSALRFLKSKNAEFESWKTYKIKDVFPNIVKPAVYHTREVKENPEGIPYVVRSKFNNGVKYYVERPNSNVNPAKVISFGAENATFFYQKSEWKKREADYGFQHDVDFFNRNIEILPSGMPEHAGRNDGNSDVGV